MFLSRLALSCGVVALLASATGCLNHTRVLYQPKPFKRATAPAATPALLPGPGVESPAVAPPTTGGAGAVSPPSQ